jgi:flavodoxin
MKQIQIDYYTGTGGSKLVAELVAEKLKKNGYDLKQMCKNAKVEEIVL